MMIGKSHRLLEGIVSAIAVSLLCGCNDTIYPNSLPPTQEEVQNIRANTSLSPQERRILLEELGITPIIINGMLQSERTGNQFGGDLRSSYGKVAGEALDTLTPDEIQIFSDAARTADTTITINLDDNAAQAIHDLFVQEHLQSSSDVSRYISDPGNEVPSEIPNDALRILFVDFDETRVLEQLP